MMVFFLVSFVWHCQVYAISSSALAQVKQATADLETVLAKPVGANKSENDQIVANMTQLLGIIQTLGDAKAVAKYQGLVDSKKQAIDLAEKNLVLQEKNSALQDAVDQTIAHIATQEKQIAKASKKLESVGLSLPSVKTTVSDVIDQINVFIDDFIKNATLLNLESFEQSLDQMVQKALKKSSVEKEKNQIIEFQNNARSIIYKKSFTWFCEGFDEITDSCNEMLELLNNVNGLKNPDQETFINTVFEDDLLMLSIVFKDGFELILKMHDNFKKSCLQNGFAKKMFGLLDDQSKEKFDLIFVTFVNQYNKIIDFLMNTFEMINAHLDDIAKTKPALAQQLWQEIMGIQDAGYQYTGALDLFETEIMSFFADHQEYKKMFSDQAKGIELIDMWDTLSEKKFLIENQSTSSGVIPPPPPLFVSGQKEVVDADFNTQLAAAVKKQKNSSHTVAIPPSSNKPVAAKAAFLSEIESKAQERANKAKDGTDPSILTAQLNARLKTFEKLEKRIDDLGKFEKGADQEIASLKQQFDDLLYDKPGAFYSPRYSMAQYFQDIPEIEKIELKLDKKMIDSKKVGMSNEWTDEQKKQFEDKKSSLKAALQQKQAIIYQYGLSLASSAVEITHGMLDTLIKNENQILTSNSLFIQFERDLSYFYFLVRFGMYEVIKSLPLSKDKMSFMSSWFSDTVPLFVQLIKSLNGIAEQLIAGQSLPDKTFGQRVIAPLFGLIELLEFFENRFQLQKSNQANDLLAAKSQLETISQGLYEKGVIASKDFQSTIDMLDNYIFQSVSHKKK